MNKVYNIATGIPKNISMQVEHRLSLRYSEHALKEILNDKYGVLPASAFPRDFNPHGWNLVEAEVNIYEVVVKFVVRRVVDYTRSLVMVIAIDGPEVGFVKTVWTNLNSDNHSTLDKSKFDKQ